MNKEIEKLANNYKEIINKTSDLALKLNDGDIRKARKWLKEQLFYTADRATNELIKLSIDNILDYQGVSSAIVIESPLEKLNAGSARKAENEYYRSNKKSSR